MWKNVGEVWESVLQVWGEGVEGWKNMGKVWESVLGVAESEKRCVGESEKRYGKVYWGAGEVA